jgi:branched-chain amino acid transport system permease protein
VTAVTAALEPLTETWRRATRHPVGGPVVKGGLFAIVTYALAKMLWSPPNGLIIYAACLGTLYGLIGIGIILIYRTNRIINFAAGGLGAVPAVLAGTLHTTKVIPILGASQTSWSKYLAMFALAAVGGAALAAVIEVVVIRRFSTSPRLILTVVTIGVAQLLAYIAFFTPDWLGTDVLPDRMHTPFTSTEFNIQGQIISADYFVAAVVVAVLGGLLAAFFRFTRMGIAVRASAENPDRASLLGIPVRRVGTVAWTIAGLFSAVTVFLRSPLVGLPLGGLTSASIILFALTAAVIARMENIPVAIAAGIAIGVLDQSSVFATGSGELATAVMLVVILVAMLAQSGQLSRAYDAGTSAWQAVKEFRPIPPELRDLSEVRTARAVLLGLVAALFLAAPFLVGESRRGLATLVLLWGIVGISLVILTGWAGQISLGQFAFVGIGAAVGGGLAANYDVDFFLTLIAGGLAGALAAVLIGLPALRIQGLFLAVTTLAFAAAAQFYLFNDRYPVGARILPKSGNRISRPLLFERIDLSSEIAYYYFSLIFLVLATAAAMSFRRHRSGRVLIAVRENPKAASAYAVNLARTKLAAFAISGFIAATAGVLFAYQLGAIDAGTYGTSNSILAFIITVVGGMSSIGGAVMGATVIQSIRYLEDVINISQLALLVTGPGLIIVLMFLPGGFAEGLYRVRDHLLRQLAARKGIHVPSLLADRRTELDEAEQDLIIRAEEHVEEVETFDVLRERVVKCPVCEAELALEDAPDHEHLRPAAARAGAGEG